MTFVMEKPRAGCCAYPGSDSIQILHFPSCVACWSSLPRAGWMMLVVDMMMVMMQHALENLNVQGYTRWFL